MKQKVYRCIFILPVISRLTLIYVQVVCSVVTSCVCVNYDGSKSGKNCPFQTKLRKRVQKKIFSSPESNSVDLDSPHVDCSLTISLFVHVESRTCRRLWHYSYRDLCWLCCSRSFIRDERWLFCYVVAVGCCRGHIALCLWSTSICVSYSRRAFSGTRSSFRIKTALSYLIFLFFLIPLWKHQACWIMSSSWTPPRWGRPHREGR